MDLRVKRMRSYRSRKKVLTAFVVTAALVAASCGGSTTDAGGSTEGTTSNEGSEQSASPNDGANASDSFPSTEVLSLAEGEKISFSETAVDVDTPILLWFYFPH